MSIVQEIWYLADLERAPLVFVRWFSVRVFSNQSLTLDLAHTELCSS